MADIAKFSKFLSQLLSEFLRGIALAPVRLGLFFVVLLLLWLPVAAPLYLWLGETVGVFLVILLYSEFLWLVGWWGRNVSGYSQPYRTYGLLVSQNERPKAWRELAIGLFLGCMSNIILFGLQWGLGWRALRGDAWLNAVLIAAATGLPTGLGVGLAEEILFRGFLLTELETSYSPLIALWSSSLVYSVLHFIKPLAVILEIWPQFLGLVLLGIAFVLGRRQCQGRLSLAVGLHGGLVWSYYVINTTNLFVTTKVVPDWVTGLGNNPLAGLLGVMCLFGLVLTVRQGWGWSRWR
ncbi:MAG: CPBP family intramembrane glutamic endopeptidase [Pseudanabaena sp. ELA607]|jgi:membrane protease YdiL (CAAX protease family)